MAERSSYPPGTFCWTDLDTTDQPAAKEFYGRLFGWEAEDFPMGEGAVYSMQAIGGLPVAAISPQPQQQRDAGAPPAWNSYIAVESADATLERAAALGGTVHAGPFDVFESGRMGVIQDPQGAFFEVWEARNHTGARLVNQAGALVWNELYCADPEAGAGFYGDLFGWKPEPMEGGPMPYLVIRTPAGRGNGGITTMEGVRPSWLVYFGSDDLEASVRRVGELGGRVMNGPMDIGVGQIAIVSDPQGAVFALYAGHFDD